LSVVLFAIDNASSAVPKITMQSWLGALPATARAVGVRLKTPRTRAKNVLVGSATMASMWFADPAYGAVHVAATSLQCRSTSVVVPLLPHTFGLNPWARISWAAKHFNCASVARLFRRYSI